MENNINKPNNKSWSTKEMVENCSKWSLAADVGLLNHLEQFSNDLLTKSEETNNALVNHLQHLQNISTSLDICKSKFLGLQNTQFIENRVYEDDDDETETVQCDKNAGEKKASGLDRKQTMKNAVSEGLKILDAYYDKIEVPASDSEDEAASTTNFILRPKDPYLSRHIPYVIGTAEWHKKWHVGLIESSSESEEDKVSEKYSDTESEVDLPVIMNRRSANVLNSTVDDVPNTDGTNSDSRQSSNNTENISNSVLSPTASNTFAEQLAAKLGNVLKGSNINYNDDDGDIEPEINRRPIQKMPTSDVSGFFDDEPPPFEDDLDEPNQSKDVYGIFSGGTGLFDEDESESFWNQSPVTKKLNQPEKNIKKTILNDDFDDDLFSSSSKNIQRDKYTSGSGVNADKTRINHESAKSQETTKKLTGSKNLEATRNIGADNNEKAAKNQEILNQNPEIPSKQKISTVETSEKVVKKPIGGVAIIPNLFGPNQNDLDIFNKKRLSEQSGQDEPDDSFLSHKDNQPFSDDSIRTLPKEPNTIKSNPTVKKQEIKEVRLFDDDDDDNDLFSNDNLFESITPKKKFTSDLFEEDNFLSGSLFSDNKTNSIKDTGNKTTDNTDTDKVNKPTEVNKEDKEINSFDHENNIKNEFLPPQLEPPQITKQTNKTISLFGNDDDLDDDLFNPSSIIADIYKNNNSSSKLVDNAKNEEIPESNKPVQNTVNDFASLIQSTVEKVHSDYLNDDFMDEPPPLTNLPGNKTKNSNFVDNSVNDLDFDDWETGQKDSNDFLSDSFLDEPPPLPTNKADNNIFDNMSNLESPRDNFDDDFLFDISAPKPSKKKPSIFDNEPPPSFSHVEDRSSVVEEKYSAESKNSTENENSAENKYSETKSKFSEIEVNDNRTRISSNKNKPVDVPKEETEEEQLQPKKEPPGKLKHNLNINVAALLPGQKSMPWKKDPVQKSESFEDADNKTPEKDFDTILEIKVSKDIPPSNTKIEEKITTPEVAEKSEPASFSNLDTDNNVEILHSMTKDRAKRINRRPSTRQGRQKQLKHADNMERQEHKDEDHLTKVRKEETKVKAEERKVEKVETKEAQKTEIIRKVEIKPTPIKQEILTKADSFEDIFSDTSLSKTIETKPIQPTPISKNDPKSNKQPAKKLPSKSLFDDEDSDDDFFPSTSKVMKLPIKSPVVEQKQAINTPIPKLHQPSNKLQPNRKTSDAKSIFQDEDENFEDIFVEKKITTKTTSAQKASLFDDDEESEDDIFGEKSSIKKTSQSDLKQKNSKKITAKPSTVKKLDSTVVKDPLDVFRN